MKRRDILKKLSLLPLAGGVAGLYPFQSKASPVPIPPASRDLFKELCIRTFINAAGTYTFMTGSLMHDIVTDTIKTASKEFCLLDEAQDKVGAKIAAMTHAEAAVVTAGAFSENANPAAATRIAIHAGAGRSATEDSGVRVGIAPHTIADRAG